MWNFLDSIPVVGHVKGVVHYATGNTEAGNRAIKDSTRSTVVMGAGAVGFAAGPMGSAALGVAAAAGAAWDSVESAATGQATGVVKGFESIAETASKGEVPVTEVLLTTLTVTGDVVGGLGGGSLASTVVNATEQVAVNAVGKSVGQSVGKSVGKSVGRSAGENIIKSASVPVGETFGKAAAQSVGKSVTKTVAKEVTKKVIIEEVTFTVIDQTTCAVAKTAVNVLQDEKQQRQHGSGGSGSGSSSTGTGASSTGTGASSTGTGGTSYTGTGGTSSGTGAGGSGQKPPRNNANQTTHSQQTPADDMQEFLTAFGVQSLDQISIRGQAIFKNLIKSERNRLKRILKAIRKKGINLKRIIKTILEIFNTVELKDVTFFNFISFIEFILQYIAERMARYNELGRRNELTEIIGTLFLPHDYTIVNVFQEIRTQIERRTIRINFRDIFAAVYHYFKHRIVGAQELSVTEYYDLIEENLHIIMNTQEYRDLLRNANSGMTFERYYARYGRRLVIGISVVTGIIVFLSTSYFEDDSRDDDKDGDIYINGEPYQPPP